MRKLFFAFFAAAVILSAGCVSTHSALEVKKVNAEKKIRTGFFVDDGSRGGGVFMIARLLYYAPQLDVTLLNGKDIRDGKLDELDLLVIPGGSSATQFKMMGKDGAAKVREFVKKGGSYVGVCAGFHCTLNRPDRVALLPYTYINGTSGLQGQLAIDISEKGAKILDVAPGRYRVSYSQGPISRKGEAWEHGSAEVLGIYKNSVGLPGRKHYDYTNHPAILFGNHGKGKVAATSFHPEVNMVNYGIFNGMVYATTGKKISQKFPEKVYRPIRVALYVGNTKGKARILRMLELDRHSELDVKIVSGISDGVLDHSDVFISLAQDSAAFRKFVETHKVYFRSFMDRGGRIIAAGSGVKAFENHKNLSSCPNGKSLVADVLKCK